MKNKWMFEVHQANSNRSRIEKHILHIQMENTVWEKNHKAHHDLQTWTTTILYPAVDDEFERLDSCRTGIRDGRLNSISCGKEQNTFV